MPFDATRYVRLVQKTSLMQAVGADADAIIAEAALLIDSYEPEVLEFISAVEPRSSPELAPRVQPIAAALLRDGFVTHCMCNRPPMRLEAMGLDRRAVAAAWGEQSIHATSYMDNLDRVSHRGYLGQVFELSYDELVVPFEQSLGAGWLNRRRNRSKWRYQYATGVVLGVVLDHAITSP